MVDSPFSHGFSHGFSAHGGFIILFSFSAQKLGDRIASLLEDVHFHVRSVIQDAPGRQQPSWSSTADHHLPPRQPLTEGFHDNKR